MQQLGARKLHNRIFVGLPADHPSSMHHAHAVKAALSRKIDLGKESVKTIQKVKSGLAIVPSTAEQRNNIFDKAKAIKSILGGSVEIAEQWMTYVVDHVPRNLQSLDGNK
ncbi:hypothetical protein EV44_g3530 [Erysiphe necator]|uniref:Uncharacterized protein n=1 Tax=Uncinula necator TaxID=52586 RepID=A0A0B1PBP4_UNCNE|nr:hypothetical protein EV44_g3530 [Erysiphe necator]